MQQTATYGADILPPGIRSRFVDGVNGLNMHILEAGFETPDRPCLLLLHGFPELAYSWRKIMVPLAQAGYHVVAPDQRGYGRTTGWDGDYDGDLTSYRFLNLVHDAYGLIDALGYGQVAAVIGHDFGSPVAADCALIRGDVFQRGVLMSAPFGGPPALSGPAGPDIHGSLAALDRPRKHYQHYYCTRPANDHMTNCPQGVHAFLRAYYHHKSADWPGNEPFPLASWTAGELAKMPTYYIMEYAQTMAETVAAEMPTAQQIAACDWLTEAEMAVYAAEYGRTGFQGGLNWYRSRTSPALNADLALFAGRTIDVPSCFIAGSSDWGIHQSPGALEKMSTTACTDMRAVHLLDGAGHWVQQEQPDAVVECLLAFLQ
ncbi:MAG: alpha/beta hydrolase [Rhodospirillaceae bacterium]|nr:alpha/beta hydrolase [Rhodospirillaceae bacterium]